MDNAWLVGTLHLLALGIGLGAVWARRGALRGALDAAALGRAFVADSWWAVAGALWFVTGSLRAFAGLEKGTEYYVTNPMFHAKFGLFVLILLLEVYPIVTLMRWRRGRKTGVAPDPNAAARIAAISGVQAALVVAAAALAGGLARGYGMRAE